MTNHKERLTEKSPIVLQQFSVDYAEYLLFTLSISNRNGQQRNWNAFVCIVLVFSYSKATVSLQCLYWRHAYRVIKLLVSARI